MPVKATLPQWTKISLEIGDDKGQGMFFPQNVNNLSGQKVLLCGIPSNQQHALLLPLGVRCPLTFPLPLVDLDRVAQCPRDRKSHERIQILSVGLPHIVVL